MVSTAARAWNALRLAALCCGCADAALAEELAPARRAEPPFRAAEAARAADSRPDSRFAFEFEGNGETARYRGALRLQLNDTSSLALRPRGGGLVVAFRSQF
jgi:hypothetical protein